MQIPFRNSYARLPEHFYAATQPTPVAEPQLIAFNSALAEQLGIDARQASDEELAQWFAGNRLHEGAEPIAMAYCGHQFGQLNPQLGDGRALLLGEVVDDQGQRFDMQLKGSGRTPFSRGGDGRSPIGPVLREYLLCEAMHALGVPTTRALAAVASGETVVRERLEPGAVFTRVAASHIRVGTFQYFALRRDLDALKTLADHVTERHFPEILCSPAANSEQPYLALLRSICTAQAELIAHWMQLGFIHGVMNTDNMTVSGETIDYGPCAFMDTYRKEQVFSSIDRGGRYAFHNQPAIGQWNLARLAETLLPLISDDEQTAVALATECLEQYSQRHQQAWLTGMRRKLGLSTEHDGDSALVDDLLALLEQGEVDYTLFFRRLSWLCGEDENNDAYRQVAELFNHPELFNDWHVRWQQRQAQDALLPEQQQQQMLATNPAYIPRNHRVAEVIKAAEEDGDLRPFHKLLEIITQPFDEQPEHLAYQQPPAEGEKVLKTFCGT
ncbi:hypothetical protein CHH28_07525 [Bacterioplanes sanyensis]|uniref:Protein nucleotidyltransferase YdiU n=1 Tax=Bacterioplanes sanyensis TaxID=1249553 RepID=A0A222FIQ2_9GAMM|nr:YdiU family protein [Bacterioplanes sanyensis]ASP38532.1 hypothetical protein CHH28_07525 [Bacterioplanes sanyensis]